MVAHRRRVLTMQRMSNNHDECPLDGTAGLSDPVAVLTESLGQGIPAPRALLEAGIPLAPGSDPSVAGDRTFRLSDHLQEALSPAQLAVLREGEEAGDIVGTL